MPQRQYEKYVLRQPLRSPDFFDPAAAGYMTMPPMMFLNGNEPIKGVGQFVEAIWIFADSPQVTPKERGPHYHDFDELFIYLGVDQGKMGELGGEVELWLGKGEKAEKYEFSTTSSVFVPKGLLHGPMNFRNVKRPFLYMTFGINVSDKYDKARDMKK